MILASLLWGMGTNMAVWSPVLFHWQLIAQAPQVTAASGSFLLCYQKALVWFGSSQDVRLMWKSLGIRGLQSGGIWHLLRCIFYVHIIGWESPLCMPISLYPVPVVMLEMLFGSYGGSAGGFDAKEKLLEVLPGSYKGSASGLGARQHNLQLEALSSPSSWCWLSCGR